MLLYITRCKRIPCNSEKEAVLHIYRQLRSSEPPDEATARDVIDKLFFSDKRYDLGDVGRYKLNKKLRSRDRPGYPCADERGYYRDHQIFDPFVERQDGRG